MSATSRFYLWQNYQSDLKMLQTQAQAGAVTQVLEQNFSLDSNGNLSSGQDHSAQVKALGLKYYPSISNDYNDPSGLSALFKSPQKFTNDLKALLVKTNADGADLDFELNDTNTTPSSFRALYPAFVSTLKSALPSSVKLSLDVDWYDQNLWDVPALAKAADELFNMGTYAKGMPGFRHYLSLGQQQIPAQKHLVGFIMPRVGKTLSRRFQLLQNVSSSVGGCGAWEGSGTQISQAYWSAAKAFVMG